LFHCLALLIVFWCPAVGQVEKLLAVLVIIVEPVAEYLVKAGSCEAGVLLKETTKGFPGGGA